MGRLRVSYNIEEPVFFPSKLLMEVHVVKAPRVILNP